MVRVGKIVWVLFQVKNKLKRCKKGYCGNEGFWFAWDCIKVRQVAEYITAQVHVTNRSLYVQFWVDQDHQICIADIFWREVFKQQKVDVELQRNQKQKLQANSFPCNQLEKFHTRKSLSSEVQL